MKRSPQIFKDGVLQSDEEWKVVYYSDDATHNSQVSAYDGNLVALSAGRVFASFSLVGAHSICPDGRGYWGDYDDVQFIAGDGTTNYLPQFIATGSDSSDATCSSTEFNSLPVHVSEVLFK
jgi:hypothetical protein